MQLSLLQTVQVLKRVAYSVPSTQISYAFFSILPSIPLMLFSLVLSKYLSFQFQQLLLFTPGIAVEHLMLWITHLSSCFCDKIICLSSNFSLCLLPVFFLGFPSQSSSLNFSASWILLLSSLIYILCYFKCTHRFFASA